MTFFDVHGRESDFEDTCTLLTILPFLMVLLSSLWNDDGITERRIFAFERERQYYFPVFSPLSSLLADIVMFKLFPPVFASVVLYWPVGLRMDWGRWATFCYAMCLIQVRNTTPLGFLVLIQVADCKYRSQRNP
jgi:hypothetical protein